MATIGLFYGSNTGNTEYVAYQIKDELDRRDPQLADIFNIGSVKPAQMLQYEYIIVGIPTWNTGQLQDDWDAALNTLEELNFAEKRIAIFGLGDQNGYGFNFLDAVGTLGDVFMAGGAKLVGLWPIAQYQFEESKAQIEDHFMGLGIDQVGQAEMTPLRIVDWVSQILFEFNLVT